MALIKEKMTQFGMVADYWKIGMISIDRDREEASYSINLYLNRDANSFIESKSVSLLGLEDKTEYRKYFGGSNYTSIVNACYEHAKAKVEYFKNAING